ncbi:MAG: prepilin-type N-terminal cleavage/methylation domain-containing protein [Microcystis wesenbergii Mw_MB_S_20031200_S109]|uniref:Prepilin-type N-terminal cleavage/methylation domain-containing protein n=1 Tax=Microcystis wesenbergii Mw_MB_S_20031200_S109D TaxID=2486241 RepID=A0A552LNG4_9CHRO|nr:MAG: prepilin-type N-terminal cleavage/methylation domain-containing protein [Microcystis wesenbergii Mw_MB_S_20031200_S109]TRV21751.1 MAG: prepilin-type N-terminal cleavage/methylation domain-containing protein [Microcystis wesenbergii Mw_MB_S_20031200_S109D]
MKYLLFLAIKSQGKKAGGFTLIELLVVVILLGVLAAISLPTLLGQIAKGRQAEARAALGKINRAQQGYRLENVTFATLSQLPIEISDGRFYNFDDAPSVTPDAFGAAYQANAVQFADEIKNYAGAAGQTAAGAYTGVICEDETPLEDNVSTSNSAGNLECVDGIRIN